MKFFLIILLSLLSFLASAQIPEQYIGVSGNRVVIRGQGKNDSAMIAPTGKDTTGNANVYGNIMFRAGYPYYYNASMWKKIIDKGYADSIGNLIDVYLVGGQSNAMGMGNSALSPIPRSGTVLQYYLGNLSAGTDPIGNASTGSAWPAFGISYNALTGHKICFVPAAVSGSSQVAAANTGQGTWDTTQLLFDTSVARTVAALAKLKASGYNPVFRGILWCQGETDAIGINGAIITQADYIAAFQKMIRRYRTAFGQPTPIYIYRIATQTNVSDVGYSQIRDAQVSVATTDSLNQIVFYNSLNFPARGLFIDIYHYSQAGLNEMGTLSARNVVSGNLGLQPQTTNNYLPTGNLGIGIGLPTFPLHVLGTAGTSVASFTGRVAINRTTPLYGLDVGDSARFRTLIISNLGFGGATSLFTSTFLTIENGQNIVINQGNGTGIPEFRMSLKASTTAGVTCGVFDFFNFAASNAGNPRQNGVITTSGFGTNINATAGNLDLIPGTYFNTSRDFTQYTNDSVRIIIRAAGTGEFYVNSRSSLAGRVKLGSVSTAALTDSVLLIATDGTVTKKNFAGFISSSFVVANITTNTTIDHTYYWMNVDATAGNVTITLPAASTVFSNNMGIQYAFKRIDNSGNTITIQRAGSDTIDGATTFTLTSQWDMRGLQCTSTSTWNIK